MADPIDVVRDWKDPDYRTGLSEHPSGEIDLRGAGQSTDPNSGYTITTTVPVATETVSCLPSCGNSFWKGTCAFLSIGCCG